MADAPSGEELAPHVRLARWVMAQSQGVYQLELMRRRVVSRATRQGAIGRYLAGTRTPALQLGTGHNVLPGWMNTDVHVFRRGIVEYLDATQPFPIPSASFQFVYSEHQIEHIPLAAGDRMLAECFRVLRPGGIVRIATPDLERMARLALPPLGEEETYYVAYISRMLGLPAPDATRVVNAIFREFGPDDASGHQFIYSYETLAERLRAAGFADARRCEVGESTHDVLRGIERHADAVGDGRVVRYETLVVEATRPASGSGNGGGAAHG
ncbi:MAG TPA: methyltransferase domain-containing protein [Longimicrobium sp.]|nr:methyltransferase domain-containing protein [Longimicrobium sp.]